VEIIKGENSDLIELEWMRQTNDSSGRHPWESSLGYDIHQDGWIFDSKKKRVVWLPHSWRVDERYWIWGGRFLGLMNDALLEPIILELYE